MNAPTTMPATMMPQVYTRTPEGNLVAGAFSPRTAAGLSASVRQVATINAGSPRPSAAQLPSGSAGIPPSASSPSSVQIANGAALPPSTSPVAITRQVSGKPSARPSTTTATVFSTSSSLLQQVKKQEEAAPALQKASQVAPQP